MIDFDELIMQSQNWEVTYERKEEEHIIRMADHHFPSSISEDEANFIYDLIVSHNLTRGYEIATGAGISAMVTGRAMKQTRGKLVTLDCYLDEEWGKIGNPDSYGWKSIHQLIKFYNLDTVFPFIGWSPTDTLASLGSIFDFSKEKLDYVFIDGLHTEKAFRKDLLSVISLLDDKYILFTHDTERIPGGIKLAETLLGCPAKDTKCRYNMKYICKGIDA